MLFFEKTFFRMMRPGLGDCPKITFLDRHSTSFHFGFCLLLWTKAGIERNDG